MRGNWETAEALVDLAPGQQIQQQQQSIMEEQRMPLHSPTTPAWGGITDRIVKEEPVEDKNNDSGVSPGHYTSNSASPRSRRSSSTANCSLSPGSATSQDSNAMPCGNFDYSPQSIFNNCGSSLEYVRLHTIDDVSRQHQLMQHDDEHRSMEVDSGSMKTGSEESEIVQDTMQCPACPFTTLNRLQFTEHLAAHYAAKCQTPDFSKSLLSDHDGHNHHEQQLQLQQYQDHNQQQLQEQQQHQHNFEQQMQLSTNGINGIDEENRASPSQGERSEQESEEADEPGLRVPRVNSQGKVKTFRCKQCNFVAITKLEFWEHSRGHIKAEKLLTCPKCPFVTEYKHHLEYHLRNHFGSKPFKCDKCSYSCVNKSMLNSHLKSHSNVYQYRCANCSYATKYCHSLKLHLRKYSHKPAMVLNADGSPNPLPIIDVYGTRRGPKQKPTNATVKNQDENAAQLTNGSLLSPSQTGAASGQLVIPPQISPVNHHLPINPMSAMQALSNGVNQSVMAFPYTQIFPGFPLSNHYSLPDESTDKQIEHLKSNIFVEYAKAMANERMNIDYSQEIGTTTSFNSVNVNEISGNMNPSKSPSISSSESNSPKKLTNGQSTTNETSPIENKVTPLDLSKPDLTSVANNNNNNTNTNNNVQQHQNDCNRIQTTGPGSNTNSPKTTGTSRRKGRAVKLDRRVVEDETDEEKDRDKDQGDMDLDKEAENLEPTNLAIEGATENCKETSPERSFGGVGMSNEFTCQYCEISFGNVVMYTVHMGYHGYKDPYTCNMCGHQCDDKVSFFLHIARSKHS